jgi:peptidoglycan/LPS O-acetylase OafA/YrhL
VGLGSVGTGAYVFPMGNGALTTFSVERSAMNAGLPLRWRLIALALFAAIMLVWVYVWTGFVNWLPREAAAILGLAIGAFVFGALFGIWYMKRILAKRGIKFVDLGGPYLEPVFLPDASSVQFPVDNARHGSAPTDPKKHIR